MSIVNLQNAEVNFKPLRPIGPGPRPIVVRPAKGRKPRANPRDAWPKWTSFTVISAVEDDDYRPTAGPDFEPTPEEEAERLSIDELAWLAIDRLVDGHDDGPRETDGFAPGYVS